MKIIFSLAGLSAAELHGNLTQLQRLDSLEQFRDGSVNFLLATDIASRGLDILGIETVINYIMPSTEAIYVHRVGRTARAGKKGRALSLIGDTKYERSMLKSIVKRSSVNTCKQRLVSPELVKLWKEKITDMTDTIKQVGILEREERSDRLVNRAIEKTENIINHEDDIHSRPARTWFISEKEKKKNIKSEEKRIIEGLIGQNKETTKEENAVPENAKIDPKVYIPARVPSVQRQPSRRERRKKEAKEGMLTPKLYNLAKKKNKAVSKEKRKNRKLNPPAAKTKKRITTKTPKEIIERDLRKPKKKTGFKSKKKYKRRK
jgi:ATP-dependent RNA helicase DDX27